MYICPHCGEAIDAGYDACPHCGGEIYQQPYGDSDESFGEGPSNKTSIVALDPEFQKGTRIVANPMIDSSTRKRSRERDRSAPVVDERDNMDEISKLIFNSKIVYKRLNFLEKITVWVALVFIIMSFFPWILDNQTKIETSGFEYFGLYVALSGFVGIVVLLLKMGFRLGLWASLLHMFFMFLSAAVVLYLKLRGLPDGKVFMMPYNIVMITAPLAFLFSFIGTMKRVVS